MAKRITAQGIFDHVYRFIVKQGRMSYGEDGVCKYRALTPAGVLCCAAGCLLSDVEAETTHEGSAWNSVCGVAPRFAGHNELIQSLQLAHDGASVGVDRPIDQVRRFKANARKIAKRLGLTVPSDV